ncbi:MAG: hypothetical protein LJE57_04735 [Gallionella sp.]|nr:hypothetical protein [Gallionella sp.]
MKIFAALVLLFVLAPIVVSDARAVEVAPFAGHRFGGSFEDANTLSGFELADANSFGVLLDFDLEPDQQIEIFLSRQDTQLTTSGTFTGNPLFDLSIDYYHIGGLYLLPDDGPMHPFVSGTFGLTRMVPKRADLTTENRLSLSLGGGAKFFFSGNAGVRFDVRAIYTMLNADTSVFCSGGCTIRVRSNGFVQIEAGAALLMRF